MDLLVKLPQAVKLKDVPNLAGKFIFDIETSSADPNTKVEWITLVLLDIPNANTNENKKS